jgi:hypothetical protein
VVADEPAADDKVVGDGDGVGVGDRLGDSVKVGVGNGLGDSVKVGVGNGLGDSVKVGVDASVAVGVRFGVSECIGDRVRLGIVAVEVPGSTGDRVGLGIVAVGVGNELAERDGVTDGRSGEPFPPHETSNSAATARPTARITSGSEAAVSNPALVVMFPPFARRCRGPSVDGTTGPCV